jgi:hypothetical protein
MSGIGRDGLQRGKVYNDGLAVFLCDSSLRGKLRKQFARLARSHL